MEITIEEFIKKGEDDYTLIDVREQYEYDEDNLEGILIPLGELNDRMEELPENKDAEIILHCRSGSRSGMACMLLESNGYTHVYNLLGGIEAYHKYMNNNA